MSGIVFCTIFGILFGIPTINYTIISINKIRIKKNFSRMMEEHGYNVDKLYLNDIFKYNLIENNIHTDTTNKDKLNKYNSFEDVYIYGCSPLVSIFYLIKNISFLRGDYSGINNFYANYFDWNTYKNNNSLLYKMKNDSIILSNFGKYDRMRHLEDSTNDQKLGNIDESHNKYEQINIFNNDIVECKKLKLTFRKKGKKW